MSGLTDLKQQLNIVGTDDDSLLNIHLAAATASVNNDIGALIAVTYDTAGPALQLAVLMKAAHFYENREAVVVGVTASLMPFGYYDLIAPYRVWVV